MLFFQRTLQNSTTRLFSTTIRPFRILGVQQIAVGGLDKSRLAALWGPEGLFGLKQTGQFRSEKENVDEDILLAGDGIFAVEVDIMAPIDATKSPKVHDPALNHIGLWVDDLQAAVKWLQGKGMRFTPGGIRKGAAGYDVCFIHPKGNSEFPLCGEGVLIELVQAPKEVKDAMTKLM
jgi:lactoylglutathione lyase